MLPENVAEAVALWFFRLNGCLTTANFVVHPSGHGGQLTDADVVAVRFPDRHELDMKDHPLFMAHAAPTLFIAEVKTGGNCRLNGPWTKREAGNMQRMLRAFGCFIPPEVELAAAALYDRGEYCSPAMCATLVAIAETKDAGLRASSPEAKQLTWDEILSFIFRRMRKYRQQKAQHEQWDRIGCQLYDAATQQGADSKSFCDEWKCSFAHRTSRRAQTEV